MTVNRYFNHIDAVEEENLYHDLAIELVQMAGIDVQYMESKAIEGHFDALFGENRMQVIDNSTTIEMYMMNMETPFEGSDMFTKFGLFSNQTCTFMVSYRRFEDMFYGNRPKEGDYIYVPAWTDRGQDSVFRIMYVDLDTIQYSPVGTNLFYILKTERARFSQEQFNTGIPDIDDGSAEWENNNSVAKDANADNSILQDLGDAFLEFDETNPFGGV